MDSKDLIRAGNLEEARKRLTEEVKASPSDPGKRTLLFQVLSFTGEWDKAERHLETIAAQDPKKETGVQVYRNLLQAEKMRTDVLHLKSRPAFYPKPPGGIEIYFEAWKKLYNHEKEAAENLLDQIDRHHPEVSGSLNGKDFSGFRDTDAFLSPFLEVMFQKQYGWVSFASIRTLSLIPPKTLLDTLWSSGRLTTWEGLVMNVYLPVLYPDSSSHDDDRVKLGRMTDWKSLGGPFLRGFGQHVFKAGETEVPILEIRELIFENPDSEKDNENRA